MRLGTGGYGYNAGTGLMGDLMAEGVLDPTKVVRVALTNAASVATMLLTTECSIVEAEAEVNLTNRAGTPPRPGFERSVAADAFRGVRRGCSRSQRGNGWIRRTTTANPTR